MEDDREALKAKLEAELAELRKDAGDSEKDAKAAVEAVKKDAEDEVAALEAEARKLRVEKNADASPKLETRTAAPDTNHGPEHDKFPGDEGDTRVLYTKPLPDNPAEQNRDLRELTPEEQAQRRNLK